jgi:tetratricopeptide (TPR) repeat protein
MYEWYYLGLALLVFMIGLGIGVRLLARSIREQDEYERRLQGINGSETEDQPAETAPEVPPAAEEPPATPVVKVRPPAVERQPAPAGEAGVTEAAAKEKVDSTKTLLDQLKSEGVDITQADKLLQLAKSTLYSGDYERAVKYATKAAKVAKDQQAKGPAPAAAAAAQAAAQAEGEDPQQKEVVALISSVQARLSKAKEESAEKGEVENLLRLATSFVRSKSYAKALRYAKQAEEKAAAITK